MPSKQPVGSTADLPPEEQITAAEEAREADIDALFGMGDDEQVAAEGGEATASTNAGAAGATSVDGQPAAPAPTDQPGATPGTPPDGTAAPAPTATPADGTSSAPSGQQAAPAAQTPTPAAAPAVVAPVDENALRVQSLEATVQALQQELANARANPAPGQPPAGAGASPQTSEQPDELPRYALTLPQQVAAALTSGDDQQTLAGITHMMNSLATIVHHNVRQEMRAREAALLQAARAHEDQSQEATQIANSREDYYKAFPDHRDPLILPIIQAESVAMAGQFPGLPWNENYRNALGQRVNARLAALRGQAQPAPGGAPAPAAPAAMLPSGTRAETPGSELTGGDLIMDTFS